MTTVTDCKRCGDPLPATNPVLLDHSGARSVWCWGWHESPAVLREGATVPVAWRVAQVAWCETCIRGFAEACGACGDLWASQSGDFRYLNGLHTCSGCWSAAGWELCDGPHCEPADLVRPGDWCDYCMEARYENENEEDSSDVIHSYGFKPEPRFHGVGAAQMGVELELELGDGYGEILHEVLGRWSDSERVFYLKEDSSLGDYGVELVHHPRDLDSWHDYGDALAGLLCDLSEAGGRAWSQSSCGLHVHLSRRAFSGRTSALPRERGWGVGGGWAAGPSSHLARFIWAVERNAEGLTGFAGRSSSYASFDSLRRAGSIADKAKMGRCGDHSAALNLSNYETVELRIFRPSLAVGRVMAAVELTEALSVLAGTVSAVDVANGALRWDSIRDWIGEQGDRYRHASHVLNGGRFVPSRTLAGSMAGGSF